MALEQAPNWSELTGEPVRVTWDDAIWWTEEAEDASKFEDRCVKETLGFLVRVTRRAVFVAHERGDDGHLWGVTRIPRGMIMTLDVLHSGLRRFDTFYEHTAT